MNKLIYLFELDSVCKSDYQIELGQKRLFEETLFHGNYVVLSYNQLTDSMAFLSAIYHVHTYDKIVELFKMGIIKVSPFNKIRTPSQYVQGRIEICLEDNADTFLFSGIPLDSSDKNKPLLNKIIQALKFSDIGILEEELENNQNADMEFLVRYIRLILILSVENLAKTKNYLGNHLTLSQIIDEIIKYYHHLDRNLDNSPIGSLLFFNAIDNLQSIKEFLIKNDIGLNNRSNWIAITNHNQDAKPIFEENWEICEIIINLCYNYTIEQSICGVDTVYDTIGDILFFTDFEERLRNNWSDFHQGHYVCYQPVRSAVDYSNIRLPRWSTAHRILSKIEKFRHSNYSLIKFTSRHAWNKKLIRYFLTAILTTFAYIIAFILAEHLVDFVKEVLSVYFETAFDKISDMKALSMMINAVFTTILFGIFGSLIAKIFKMPDILEGIRDIFVTFHDLKIILNYYFNHKI